MLLEALPQVGYASAVLGDELASWAEQEASALLSQLGERWQHVQAVAEKAIEVARILAAEDRSVLVAAAYLHDVGYAPSLNRLGFHAVDGAHYLRDQGQERLASLVAYHSGARFEAEERGLVKELVAFEPEDGPVMDALTFVDMTTGPTGRPMSLDERVAEIAARYAPDDPVHRAIVRARGFLQAAVERTLERLQGADGQPM
jgi:putative nucleotidyltransferase with HDIG domain